MADFKLVTLILQYTTSLTRDNQHCFNSRQDAFCEQLIALGCMYTITISEWEEGQFLVLL